MRVNRRDNGITLVSLVITIIVMLILAGVGLSMVTGEGSVLDKAIAARDAQTLAGIKEELEMMFLDYNMKQKYESEDNQSLTEFLTSKVDDGFIDSFKSYPIDGFLKMVIEKDEYYFYVQQIGDEYQVSTMGTNLNQITDGFTVVTAEQFNQTTGTMTFDLQGDATSTVIFYDEINDTFNFEVLGGNVTIYVSENMTLTNNGMTRSAVDIAKGATLNIHIAAGKTMTVDSGFGVDGITATAVGAAGGNGGYAGIHVPDGATLNLSGEGTLIAYGGNAGAGGGAVSGNTGGGGGGGAGAGIGGNGGTGGSANKQFNSNASTIAKSIGNCGNDGEKGEDCGTVKITGPVKIYAYGGAGGAGGTDKSYNSGAGAGGYPAAGIGGGGAGGGGGEHACAAGGYTAGSGEGSSAGSKTDYSAAGTNGSGSTKGCAMVGGGGGYYTLGPSTAKVRSYYNQGGIWYKSSTTAGYTRDHAGSGGMAGKGGNIYYYDLANIFAYNGDMVTNDNYTTTYYKYTHVNGETKTTSEVNPVVTKQDGNKIVPATIFAQLGVIRATYKTNQHLSDSEADSLGVKKFSGTNPCATYVATPEGTTDVTEYGQGIGSGAGALEVGNGTLQKYQ